MTDTLTPRTDAERNSPWELYKTGDDPEWRGRQPNSDWVCARWDELWRTQLHGHYETLMRVVLDARKREYVLGIKDATARYNGIETELSAALVESAKLKADAERWRKTLIVVGFGDPQEVWNRLYQAVQDFDENAFADAIDSTMKGQKS